MGQGLVISFKKVHAAYGWMSNMSPHPVDLGGGTIYKTAEHLFQALRFPPGSTWQLLVKNALSPMGAKMTAKKYAEHMEVPERGALDLANMYKVISLKLEQYPHLKKELIATGNALLVEDVTSRPHGSGKFWGAAKVVDPATNDVLWNGENWLGKLWMRLRDEVK